MIRVPATLDTSSQTPSEAPQQPGSNEAHQLPTIQESSNGKAAEEADATTTTATSKPKTPLRPKLSAPVIAPASLRPTTNVGAWKAPDDWAVSPTESAISGIGTEDINDAIATDQLASLALDLAHMEREADHMRGASPQVILRHLKNEFGHYGPSTVTETGPGDDRGGVARTTDEVVACHDRDMKKQRWLLSALYNMETVWDTKEEVPKPAVKPTSQKILALFESHGSSSHFQCVLSRSPQH